MDPDENVDAEVTLEDWIAARRQLAVRADALERVSRRIAAQAPTARSRGERPLRRVGRAAALLLAVAGLLVRTLPIARLFLS